MHDVIIIGGGLSGLINAFLLSKGGLSVLLIEKKSYPFHRVCGEYISNEVVPFLKAQGLYPDTSHPVSISSFQLSSISGESVDFPLDLGGFGISRYTFDNFLYEKNKRLKVDFMLNSSVKDIFYRDDVFNVKLNNGQRFDAKVVIGAYGKRSNIDKHMQRTFMKKRSPYIGVKYHIKIDHPDDLIVLHNFRGGYCGMSNVENGTTNLCYLGKRLFLRLYGNIERMEKEVLYENPHLKKIFKNAEFLFKKPLVINEISFATKTPVENHVLMSGDAAGMITPLCGNGMAIAIRSAKLLSEIVLKYFEGDYNRHQMESKYRHIWNANFRARLWAGRKIQSIFGKPDVSSFAVRMARASPVFRNTMMKQTHGNPF